MDKPQRLSRRAWLKGGVYAVGVGTLYLLSGRLAAADTGGAKKVSKTIAHYQDHPKDGKSCATCRFFNPSGMGGGMMGGRMGGMMDGGPMGGMMSGTCQVVEGEVAANAYCDLYAPA